LAVEDVLVTYGDEAMWYMKNVPGWERVLRVAVGVVAAGLAVWLVPGTRGWVLGASALGLSVSGLVGFCPMCALVGRRLDKPR